MSSPIRRRSALTGKNVNINSRPKSLLTKSISNTSHTNINFSKSPSTSPLRRSQTPSIRGSPLKKTLSTTPSPIKRRQSDNVFTFHEDDSATRESIKNLQKLLTISENNNSNMHNKENNAPGKRDGKKSSNETKSDDVISVRYGSDKERMPLTELKTVDFMGYIEDPRTNEVRPLNVPFANNMTMNSSHSSLGSSSQGSPSRILRF
ncbi:hypothetical protein C6P45_005455 [Maudiozyma exigua]|uniref:Uncharacterized protein n=1 Tax=Maudiozyma exigua TaxID=34358 RepID=A0A9P6WAD1_MAUEX|nr:hypothetical protein C6P45_005455 [Kazachstania exigua]